MLGTEKTELTVSSAIYDLSQEGAIYSIIIKSDRVTVGVTNLGCAIISIETPDRVGKMGNIVAGYADLNDYYQNPHYFGCLLGRYANRISNAKFKLDHHSIQLSANDGVNHLHGGKNGFNKKIWNVVEFIQNPLEAGVEFSYYSRNGEEGY